MKNTKNRTKLILAQIKVNELSVLLLTNPVVLSVFPTPELSIIFITIDDIKEIVPAPLVMRIVLNQCFSFAKYNFTKRFLSVILFIF